MRALNKTEELVERFAAKSADWTTLQLEEVKKTIHQAHMKGATVLESRYADESLLWYIKNRIETLTRAQQMRNLTPEQQLVEGAARIMREHHVSRKVADGYLQKQVKSAPPPEGPIPADDMAQPSPHDAWHYGIQRNRERSV